MSDITDVVDNDTIEAVIEQVPGTDDADPPTVAGIRELLAYGDPAAETGPDWDEWVERVEGADWRVVAEQDRLVMLDAGPRGIYADVLSDYDGPVAVEKPTLRVIATLHRRLAGEFAPDHDWTLNNPYAFVVPAAAGAGKEYVELVVTDLLRRGLSPGQAWAYYGVVIRGNSRNAWAEQCGYSDHSAVSGAVRTAESKLA